ncbi:MAG: hypothetical protein ABSF95_18620 [Verrucomicrobiota bacterium]|jgi:hypothetical protein
MPAIEDPVDDPWQGRWLEAATEAELRGRDCRLTFLPLKPEENPKAANLQNPVLAYLRRQEIPAAKSIKHAHFNEAWLME